MKRINFSLKAVLIPLILTLVLPNTLLSKQQTSASRKLLFKDADRAKQVADSLMAEILSPDNYSSALKYYNQADKEYKGGGAVTKIKERLKSAEEFFLKAAESARLFRINLPECLEARKSAERERAEKYCREKWNTAERSLIKAARILERGNLKDAVEKSKMIGGLYKKAESEAIKARILNEVKQLVSEAETRDVSKRAPATLNKAKELLREAETVLNKNCYDTLRARTLSDEAKYCVKHALYLSNYIKGLDKNQTIETLLLSSEKPLERIGSELNIKVPVHQGRDSATEIIIDKIRSLKKENESLKEEVSKKDDEIASLQERLSSVSLKLSDLESQIGDLKSSEAELKKYKEEQQRIKNKFAKIENSFTREEAAVLRASDRIIIRLYGLNFPVGKSVIEPKYFGLLSKVVSAIEQFPESRITIEGHTDSRGSESVNQKLSAKRAMAVYQYFIATAGIDSSRIEAIGYGESKPIASNETKEGREKNRRIDIIIHTEEHR